MCNPSFVENKIPLLDSKCPTMAVLMDLYRKGWKGSTKGGTIDHRSCDVGFFDATEATRMRSYFQALLCLQRCLTCTLHMPSREPILYYQFSFPA